jgi:hypothetical protein
MKNRKHITPHTYEGRVGVARMKAQGRTKREAVTRLRRQFAASGLQTIVRNESGEGLAYTDRLTVKEVRR